ncbi:MAG: hypothetical protein WA459_22285 [Stellaceae bacterium]
MTDDTALARLARQYSREAIAALVFAIRNSTDVRVRVTAALGLLDRGYGRPAQAKLPVPEYSLEDVDQMIAYLEQKVATDSDNLDLAMPPPSRGEAVPEAGAPLPAISIADAASRASEELRRTLR